MNFKAYIFDFDGTLVDSMPYWSEKMLNILRKTNTSYPDDIIKRLTTLGDKGTAKYFREALGVKLSEEEMFRMMDDFAMDKYRNDVMLKEGVGEYLTKLKALGKSLHVLTASPHKMVDMCLKRIGIFDIFDNVWSCDDFDTVKSDPEIYVKAVQKIGVNTEEAVFFDDNITAIETASKAGLYTVGVYDETSKDYADSIKEIAEVYIHSFSQIKEL